MNHPYTGEMTCEAGQDYVLRTRARVAAEARTLARLAGWDVDEVLERRAAVPETYR